MKMNAYVAGIGMTRFSRMMDRGLKSIGGEAVLAALADAGLEKKDVEAAWMSNAAAGVLTGQECIRGQVVLRSIGMGGLPVINVENACASASTAFNQACAMVTAGVYDVVLACGVEKMYLEDKAKVFGAFMGAVDVEQLQSIIEFSAEIGRCQRCKSRFERRGPKPIHVHGHLCSCSTRPHGALRNHGRAVRHDLGEELFPWVTQSACAVPRSDER